MEDQSKMESQTKPAGFDGTQVVPTGMTPTPTARSAPMASSLSLPGLILRIAAVVLTLLSAIIMGAARQKKTYLAVDAYSGDLLTVTQTMKSTYSAGFVYFIIIDSVAFVYSSVALAITVATRGRPHNLAIAIGDLIIVALLFSANGAANAINLVAERGQDNLAWAKFCDIAGKFCSQVRGAIALSNLAAIVYLVMLMLVIIRLHRRA